MLILIEGSKILFGEDIQPINISKEKFALLQKYFNSFGYVINYNYDNINGIPCKVNIWFTLFVPEHNCHHHTSIL